MNQMDLDTRQGKLQLLKSKCSSISLPILFGIIFTIGFKGART